MNTSEADISSDDGRPFPKFSKPLLCLNAVALRCWMAPIEANGALIKFALFLTFLPISLVYAHIWLPMFLIFALVAALLGLYMPAAASATSGRFNRQRFVLCTLLISSAVFWILAKRMPQLGINLDSWMFAAAFSLQFSFIPGSLYAFDDYCNKRYERRDRAPRFSWRDE
jgi:hypothetical protein